MYDDPIGIWRIRLNHGSGGVSCGTWRSSARTLSLLGILELKMRKSILDIHLLVRVERCRLMGLLKRSSHVLLAWWVLNVVRM